MKRDENIAKKIKRRKRKKHSGEGKNEKRKQKEYERKNELTHDKETLKVRNKLVPCKNIAERKREKDIEEKKNVDESFQKNRKLEKKILPHNSR